MILKEWLKYIYNKLELWVLLCGILSFSIVLWCVLTPITTWAISFVLGTIAFVVSMVLTTKELEAMGEKELEIPYKLFQFPVSDFRLTLMIYYPPLVFVFILFAILFVITAFLLFSLSFYLSIFLLYTAVAFWGISLKVSKNITWFILVLTGIGILFVNDSYFNLIYFAKWRGFSFTGNFLLMILIVCSFISGFLGIIQMRHENRMGVKKYKFNYKFRISSKYLLNLVKNIRSIRLSYLILEWQQVFNFTNFTFIYFYIVFFVLFKSQSILSMIHDSYTYRFLIIWVILYFIFLKFLGLPNKTNPITTLCLYRLPLMDSIIAWTRVKAILLYLIFFFLFISIAFVLITWSNFTEQFYNVIWRNIRQHNMGSITIPAVLYWLLALPGINFIIIYMENVWKQTLGDLAIKLAGILLTLIYIIFCIFVPDFKASFGSFFYITFVLSFLVISWYIVFRLYHRAYQWELLTKEYLRKIGLYTLCNIVIFLFLLYIVPRGNYQISLFLLELESLAFIVSLPASLVLIVYQERHQ